MMMFSRETIYILGLKTKTKLGTKCEDCAFMKICRKVSNKIECVKGEYSIVFSYNDCNKL